MSLTIGILSWGSQKTLLNSLFSYNQHTWGEPKRYPSLLDLADEKIIYFQEIDQVDINIARSYDFKYLGTSENLGIAEGYKRLVEEATSEFFLFLENDWELIESPQEQIITGLAMLNINLVDVIRYRHRKNPGHPLWTRQFEGDELSRPEHLLDSIHWTDPIKFPQIKKIWSDTWYLTAAKNANWTNNPTMFRTDWLKENILPRMTADIEKDLQPWWQQQSYQVAQGEGLFTHNRIG